MPRRPGHDDVAVFAWDARGHGRSSGARGAAESVAALVQDLDDFVRHLVMRHGIAIERTIVMGSNVDL